MLFALPIVTDADLQKGNSDQWSGVA